MTVWKYTLDVADEQEILMPAGAELLTVDCQFSTAPGPFEIWARVNPEAPQTVRKILVRGTGHEIGDEPYVGSVIQGNGALVWHVFDGGER